MKPFLEENNRDNGVAVDDLAMLGAKASAETGAAPAE